jgi:formylglycine-generating enzyme required for sulfatase activity
MCVSCSARIFVIGSTFRLVSRAWPAAAQAATTLKDCDQCPELVVIPAGQFTMGAVPGEQGAEEDEGLPHT